MTEVAAWVVFPLLLFVLCTGCGLLAERAAGAQVGATLVPPLGLAAAIVLVGPGFALGLGTEVAVPLLLVAAAAGLVLARRDLRDRFRPGAGAAAGGLVYGLYMVPVVLTGDATFLGYNVLNDTAVHLLLVDHLAQHGTHEAAAAASPTLSATFDAYIGKSYPVGSHELLAAVRPLAGVDAVHLYQPFIAASAGFAAAALVQLVRKLGLPALVAAGAAALAMSSQLLFSFELQGGIKEIGFVAVLATLAALGYELLRSDTPVRLAVLAAIPAVAGFAIYGLSALAWLAPFALLVAGWALAEGASPLRRRLLPAAAAALIAFGALGAPAIAGSFEFYDKGKDDLTSESELGPLVGPIRAIQATGIWLKGDYRQLPDQGGRKSYLLGGVALVLAVLGTAHALRRRAPGPLLFLASAFAAWFAVKWSASPYIDAKLLAVLSPAVLLAAALGVVALWTASRRLEAAAAGLVLVAAVGLSDVLAYRHAQPAPLDRLLELRDVGEEFAGDELMLVNEYEDYAKYFARDAEPYVPYDGLSPLVVPRRPEARRKEGERILLPAVYTLDELRHGFVTKFPRILVRRSPAESRPPAGYERVFAGRWYELWERQGTTPATHLPLARPSKDPWSAARVPACSRLRSLGGELTAVERPEAVLFDISAQRDLPPGWKRAPDVRLALDAYTGGSVSAKARTLGGPHRIWIQGSLYRGSTILLDGEVVGVAKATQGPEQWIEVGTADLDPGIHTAELRRPRRSLDPGDARSDVFGPIVAVPETPQSVVTAPAQDLCGKSLDWLERQ